MIRCTLRATTAPPVSMQYTFFDEEGLPILTNATEEAKDNFDVLLREVPIIPYTLSLIDAEGNELFSLHKKTAAPFGSRGFTMVYGKGRIVFEEDKERFSMPDISFWYNRKKFDLVGFVRAREFFIEYDEQKLATITGRPVIGGKEYYIHILSDALPLEAYFAAALILDIYFHNY
ncbi:Uncharacterised protein [Aedoeadaptatus ivorii]|uniref:Scramblase n=1 Tax=Aedoeadaptatus ivorii TaxID=54006 RepID=A0A448V0E2_9FIRM|nr:hypothetical protein [Peptoniphilus ivorii]MDQ0507950.1 hypothetical protein [Peptoniphilus ivorii]VEJ34761.1 Uncharacterised protein [Peptoniphilus ivorii]